MPTDTIRVLSGTYTEQVVFPANKDLITVTAVGPHVTIKAPATFSDPSDAIIHIDGGQGITIKGFTITGGNTANADYGVLVDDNGSAFVTDNTVTDIRPAGDTQNGVGISFGLNSTSGAATRGMGTVSDNLVTDYQKDGIEVIGAGSNVAVSGNIVRGDGPNMVVAQNGIQVSDGAVAFVRNNLVSGNKYTGTADAEGVGILVYQTSGISVTGNAVFGNDEGILLYADDPSLAVTNTTVSKNVTEGNTFNGIGLFNANNDTVSNNFTARNGFDGINLEQATGDQVTGNDAFFNGRDGIALEATATGNTVKGNEAFHNQVDDLFDDSQGSGTAGTANTWTDNEAGTSSPAGLGTGHDHGNEHHGHGRHDHNWEPAPDHDH
jgi:parallel beta-helix repeat protein